MSLRESTTSEVFDENCRALLLKKITFLPLSPNQKTVLIILGRTFKEIVLVNNNAQLISFSA